MSNPLALLPDRLDQDLEVLAHQGILFRGQTALQFLLHAVEALAAARRKTGAEIGDLIVERRRDRAGAAPSGASRACSWSTTRVCSLLRFTQSGAGAGDGRRGAARQLCRRQSRRQREKAERLRRECQAHARIRSLGGMAGWQSLPRDAPPSELADREPARRADAAKKL